MKNDYEIRGELTAIIIHSQKYGMVEALISTGKLERVKEFPNSWFVVKAKSSHTYYIQGKSPKINGKQKPVYMHRWITNAPQGMQVDHLDNNGINNTDNNLRIATRSENQQNKKGAFKTSKSGIRGVFWDNRKNKWRVQLILNKKCLHIGYFDDIDMAELAVKEARKKYMPYSKEASA